MAKLYKKNNLYSEKYSIYFNKKSRDVSNPWRGSLVDVFFSQQPAVDKTSSSAGTVGVQAHIPNPAWPEISSAPQREEENSLFLGWTLFIYHQWHFFFSWLRLKDSRWAVGYRKKESHGQPENFQKKHDHPGWPVQQNVQERRPPRILWSTDSH